MASLIRYHVNVYWEKAPDRRTSRTLDWLNDACEAKLKDDDRDHGEVKYKALMSPVSIVFISRAKVRLGKRKYTRKFPISLLLTQERTTTGAGKATPQTQRYVLLGMERWPGGRVQVSKVKRYEWTILSCDKVEEVTEAPRDPARRAVTRFQCMLHTGTADLDVRFATRSEANVLFDCLKPRTEPKAATVKSGS